MRGGDVMQSSSQQLNAAITSPERVVRHTLTYDWDNDGVQDIDDMSHKIGQVQVSQSLESSLPPSVRIVPGVAVAQLDATLARGNTNRALINASFKSINSASSGSGSGFVVTIPGPSGVQVDDIIIAGFVVADASNFDSLLLGANVDWATLAIRGDGFSSGPRVELQAYARRAVINEPTTYGFTLNPESIISTGEAWYGFSCRIGDAGLMGIVDVVSKGSDDNVTITPTVTLPPLSAPMDNCVVVSLYAAAINVSGTASWVSNDVNDIERLDAKTTRSTPNTNVSIAVYSQDNVARGTYTKSATVTTPMPVISTIGLGITLAPRLAGDERQHAAWTFSELNPDSPYAGKSRTSRRVAWDVGFHTANGLENTRIFTGLSLTAGASSKSRTAEISALDYREAMRNPWYLPGHVTAELPTSDVSYSPDPANIPSMPGLESTWIVSRLFAYAYWQGLVVDTAQERGIYSGFGFFASPPFRPRAVMLWVPMHGSLAPFEGLYVSGYTQTQSGTRRRVNFYPGPFVAGTERAPTGGIITSRYRCDNDVADIFTDQNQIKGRIEFWARLNNTNSRVIVQTIDDFTIIDFMVKVTLRQSDTNVIVDTQVATGITRHIVGPALPTDDDWHFYSVHVDSAQGTAYFYVDTVASTTAFSTWSNSAQSLLNTFAQVDLDNEAQMSDLYVHGSFALANDPNVLNFTYTTPPISMKQDGSGAFQPSAFIDKSPLQLDVLPVIDENADAWAIVSSIADAEYAAVYFDGQGRPHFRNSRSDASATGQTIQRIITARQSLKDLQYESGVQQIVNLVSVGYAPMLLVVNQQVWSAGGAIKVPAASTLTITIQTNGLAVSTPGFLAAIPGNSSPSGSGINVTNILPSAGLGGYFSFEIEFENPNAFDVWLVDTTGSFDDVFLTATYWTPAATPSPVVLQNRTSQRKYGFQPLNVSANPWIQNDVSAGSVAQLLVSSLGAPRPTIKQMPIIGDPRIELGDLDTIQDQNGQGVNGQYRITGLQHNGDPGSGFSQQITVREASMIAYWNFNAWNDGTVWAVVE